MPGECFKGPRIHLFRSSRHRAGTGRQRRDLQLVDDVLLKASEYPQPQRIVEVWERPPDGSRNVISPANYIDWTGHSRNRNLPKSCGPNWRFLCTAHTDGVAYSSAGLRERYRLAGQ